MVVLKQRITASLINNGPPDVYDLAQGYISTMKPDGSWADISKCNLKQPHTKRAT